MLACVAVFRVEADVIYVVNRGLTKEYEIECRSLLCQPGVCRADIESIIRERLLVITRDKKSGSYHALFAGAPRAVGATHVLERGAATEVHGKETGGGQVRARAVRTPGRATTMAVARVVMVGRGATTMM